jgi:hypothetical protein
MTDNIRQAQLKKINKLPINLLAKLYLQKVNGPANPNEIHAIQLLRVQMEDGKADIEIGPEDLEQSILDLIEMQSYDPKRTAELMNLKEMDDDMTSSELVEELIERVNDLTQERLI